MSKNKGRDVQKRVNDAYKNTNVNSSESRREELMVEIRSLKLLIATIECTASTTKFAEITTKKDLSTTIERKKFSNLIDTELMIKSELYSLAGVCCKKVGNAFIFGFECWHIERPKNDYWIQLYNDVDQWQLGRWLMPMSVNVNDILTRFSIDSPNDMIYFLRECKHQIECYNHRKQQYHELEVFMNANHYNGSIEADCTFMRITIKLLRATYSSPDESRFIRVDLYYKTDETRSSRMIIDCEDIQELSDREMKKLKIYFKSFKELDLKDAAEKILLSEESQLIWGRESQDEVIEIDEDLDYEVEASFMKILEKSAKATKKVDKLSRTENADLTAIEDTDEDPTDDQEQREKGNKSGNKKTEKINDQKNNKSYKPQKKMFGITEKLPLRDRNENVVNSSSKVRKSDKSRILSRNRIQLSSSTPLTGRIAPRSKIAEDEISEIAMETTMDDKKMAKSRQFDESDSSAKSDEKNSDEQTELLKELRAANNDNPTNKVGNKALKRKLNAPTRGRNKIANK